MIRFSPVLRAVPATVAAVGVALAVGLGGVGAAYADSPTAEPTGTACAWCEQPTTGPEADRKPDPKPTQTQEPSVPAQPVIPAPAPPAKEVPAAPKPEPTLAPEPEPTLAPEPSATVEETAAPVATTASPSPSTASPSTESNWNKPITKSARPTHAAAVSDGDGPGFDTGLLPITAGVLLIGVGGISFAWWSRNRVSTH